MKKTMCMAVCICAVVFMLSGIALSASEKTANDMKGLVLTVIMGTMNTSNELVDIDGQTFHVADNEEGRKLFSHTGQKVLVSGTVIDREGKKQIIVLAYKFMPEHPDY